MTPDATADTTQTELPPPPYTSVVEAHSSFGWSESSSTDDDIVTEAAKIVLHRLRSSIDEGYELCHDLRQQENGREIAICALALAETGHVISIEANPYLVLRLTAFVGTRGQMRRVFESASIDINADGSGNKYAESPLITAAKWSNNAAAGILLRRGANPSVRSRPEGITALHYAARANAGALAKRLLDFRAATEAKSKHNGHTPLLTAARANASAVAEILLEFSADTEARSKTNGYTPLQYAARVNAPAVAESLLEFRADIEARSTRTGQTALQIAENLERVEIAEMLRGEENPS